MSPSNNPLNDEENEEELNNTLVIALKEAK